GKAPTRPRRAAHGRQCAATGGQSSAEEDGDEACGQSQARWREASRQGEGRRGGGAQRAAARGGGAHYVGAATGARPLTGRPRGATRGGPAFGTRARRGAGPCGRGGAALEG